MYGQPVNEPHGEPIAELIKTVLSQHTNDRNRDRSFAALRERFPTWEEVRDAPSTSSRRRSGPAAWPAEGAADPGDPRAARRAPDLGWSETAPREESLEFLLSLPGWAAKPPPAC
jgi:endonuclease-3